MTHSFTRQPRVVFLHLTHGKPKAAFPRCRRLGHCWSQVNLGNKVLFRTGAELDESAGSKVGSEVRVQLPGRRFKLPAHLQAYMNTPERVHAGSIGIVREL